MPLLVGASFENAEQAATARAAVRRLGLPLARDLLLPPDSPSLRQTGPDGPDAPAENPIARRTRHFNRRVASSGAGGAILLGTLLGAFLWPLGLPFVGTVIGATVGGVVGTVVGAMNSEGLGEDALMLLVDSRTGPTWLLIFEVDTAPHAQSVRQTLEHLGGSVLDPWDHIARGDHLALPPGRTP